MKKIIVLSVLVIIGILFTAQIKRGVVSLLILADSVRPPEKAVMGRFIDGPSVKKVNIQSGGRSLHADLYIPKEKGLHFPFVIVHGVNPTGKDDEQLVLLAKNFARAGFLVMVPDLEGMKALRIRISDAEDILQSFLYVSRLKDAKRDGGMLGISYGAGPMLLASADPRIRDKVNVVVSFGGYYDLRNVMLFAMTGNFEYGGHRGWLRPEESLRWMLAYRNLDILRTPADRNTLRKIIEKRNRYETAEAAVLAKSLGPEGRALYDFLMNTDQERFGLLYENLPVALREQVYQLSPARAVKYIQASFLIAHGMEDYSIPYTESLRLADAVGDTRRVHLELLPQFMHIEPVEPSMGTIYRKYVLGGWRLFSLIYDLLGKGAQANRVHDAGNRRGDA
jgi:dienelactone hydrolase